VDIAGLVKGASEGQGLGNQFLQHIRETNAIAQVVRIFEDPDILHVDGRIHPVRDIEVINLELVLSDLQIVAKRLNSVDRDVKRGDKTAILEQSVLQKLDKTLSEGRLASETVLTDEEKFSVRGLQLLTMKPIMYILNKKAGGHNLDEMKDPRYTELVQFIESMGATYAVVDAGFAPAMSRLYIFLMPFLILGGLLLSFTKSSSGPWKQLGRFLFFFSLLLLLALIAYIYKNPWAGSLANKAIYIAPFSWSLGFAVAQYFQFLKRFSTLRFLLCGIFCVFIALNFFIPVY
jgi:hypothetical protein